MALVFVFGRSHLDGGHTIACEIWDVYYPLGYSANNVSYIFVFTHYDKVCWFYDPLLAYIYTMKLFGEI